MFQKLKENYQINIIRGLILLLFINVLIRGVLRLQDYYLMAGPQDFTLSNPTFPKMLIEIFKPTFYALIPIIGVFLKRKIGWSLLASYFYFLTVMLAFRLPYEDFTDTAILIISLIFLAIVLFLIGVLNIHKIRGNIYGIPKDQFIIYNIIAFVIGMIINYTHTLTL